MGQEVAKRILIAQSKTQKVANAYLFYGPRGVGKMLTAKTFIKALNCEQSDYDACDTCATCKSIEGQKNPDFDIIFPGEKGRILIDQIRGLKKRASYRSIWLNYRATIIRKADTLMEEAANAFLKILEEPPPRTIFILITQKPYALLPTIRSRCQAIRFRRLQEQEIKKIITSMIDITSQDFEYVSQLANGDITHALKLLEPEERELRIKTFEFFQANPLGRLHKVQESKILEVEAILFYLESFYMDSFSNKIGVSKLIKNKDFEFEKSLPLEEVSKAVSICEGAFRALRQNVHKKLILYQLIKELP